MKWYQKLHWQIIIGLFAGLLWGLLSSAVGINEFTSDYIRPFGDIFVQLLKLIAVPLILVSLVVGVASLNDMTKLSRMGGKTLGIYVLTSVIAILIGLTVVNVMNPGGTLPLETRTSLMESYGENVEGSDEAADEFLERSPLYFFVDMVPENLFAAASDNTQMLQVVFVAILIGIGIVNLPRAKTEPLIAVFRSFNDVVIKIVELIMKLAPIGVFALMAVVIVDLAGDDLGQAVRLLTALGWYSLAVIIGLLLHFFLVYGTLIRLFSNVRFSEFIRAMQPAFLLGFSTSSSMATLPVTMERAENNLGVHEEVASFVMPVGATVNMDGTTLYQAVAAVFIAQALGLDLTLAQQATIVLTATLASIGAAGVPGAGIIMLVIVLQSVQVPVEGIALILGVDRILDMMRTAINIAGDSAVAVVVASTEGKLGEVNLDD
ncbi:MAG TPA: dicarboxylate/amino acid:cation symporter [Balneolaceae bacterium]|nr:dicarboxylate/amino acid:cation symporter [Balneolaceae bacterium]